ncbi:hypothetical protein HHI36_005124, partial [Cryptolaemus montrouzieri]
ALECKELRRAIIDKVNSIKENETWIVIENIGHTIVVASWNFTFKEDENEGIRRKGRQVANGNI